MITEKDIGKVFARSRKSKEIDAPFRESLRWLCSSGQIERYRSRSRFTARADAFLFGAFCGFVAAFVIAIMFFGELAK
jgi:hypothetical protein